jgi:hypothetical protein
MENITILTLCGWLVFAAFYIARDIRNSRQTKERVAPVDMLPDDPPIDSDKACEAVADITGATIQVAGEAVAHPEAVQGTMQGIGHVIGHIVDGILHHR